MLRGVCFEFNKALIWLVQVLPAATLKVACNKTL